MGEGGEPFKARAFEGGGKIFTENDVVGCIEGDIGYVYFEVLVGVDFFCITV